MFYGILCIITSHLEVISFFCFFGDDDLPLFLTLFLHIQYLIIWLPWSWKWTWHWKTWLQKNVRFLRQSDFDRLWCVHVRVPSMNKCFLLISPRLERKSLSLVNHSFPCFQNWLVLQSFEVFVHLFCLLSNLLSFKCMIHDTKILLLWSEIEKMECDN